MKTAEYKPLGRFRQPSKTTGRRVRGARRIRHRGVNYRIRGHAVYRESDGAYIVSVSFGRDANVRREIDAAVSGKRLRFKRYPKLRQFGRIISGHEARAQRREYR